MLPDKDLLVGRFAAAVEEDNMNKPYVCTVKVKHRACLSFTKRNADALSEKSADKIN